MNKAIRQDRELMGKLPCGHEPHVDYDVDHHMANRLDGGRAVLDQCFECDWMTPARKLSNQINEAAAKRGEAETHLVKLARSTGTQVMNDDEVHSILDAAIRVGLRHGREESLREHLKEIEHEV